MLLAKSSTVRLNLKGHTATKAMTHEGHKVKFEASVDSRTVHLLLPAPRLGGR